MAVTCTYLWNLYPVAEMGNNLRCFTSNTYASSLPVLEQVDHMWGLPKLCLLSTACVYKLCKNWHDLLQEWLYREHFERAMGWGRACRLRHLNVNDYVLMCTWKLSVWANVKATVGGGNLKWCKLVPAGMHVCLHGTGRIYGRAVLFRSELAAGSEQRYRRGTKISFLQQF